MTDPSQTAEQPAVDKTDGDGALIDLVYPQLREMAAHLIAAEQPGITLQATALVHEMWLRMQGGDSPTQWQSKSQFLFVASEAMRRILVDEARRRKAKKRGGDRKRMQLDVVSPSAPELPYDPLQLDEALARLLAVDPVSGMLVKLHIYGGASIADAADALNISVRTAFRNWEFARAWLYRELSGST